MPKFRMRGGNHVEGTSLYPGGKGFSAVVESDKPLDEMFANKFEKVEDGSVQATAATYFSSASKEPIRRTAASEAQNLQKPNAGHEVPVVPNGRKTEFDSENAEAADKLENENLDGGLYDPEFEEPAITTLQGHSPTPRASRRRAERATAAKATSAPSDEDDDGTEPGDVTGDFENVPEGYTVHKEGRRYMLYNENGNKVGSKEGYTKKEATEELAKRAGA